LVFAITLSLQMEAYGYCNPLVESDGIVFDLGLISGMEAEFKLKSTFNNSALVSYCGEDLTVKLNDKIASGRIVEIGFGFLKVEINNEISTYHISW
jgi:hypothetical protein